MSNNVWACMIMATIHTTAYECNHRAMFLICMLAALGYFWIERKK